jgi:hypothetical protein
MVKNVDLSDEHMLAKYHLFCAALLSGNVAEATSIVIGEAVVTGHPVSFTKELDEKIEKAKPSISEFLGIYSGCNVDFKAYQWFVHYNSFLLGIL